MALNKARDPGPPVDITWLNTKNWWSDVDAIGDGCWPWLKSTGSHGYGQTWDGTTVRLAHRVAWVLHHQEQIPAGITIDHICRNRLCCRPDHLRLLTNVDNAADNSNARKTHCKRGHPFNEVNTRLDGRGHRRCLQCQTFHNAGRF